jgi:UDP-N-acetylmuramoyl-tripeptide--D-alanyl-D-alanine ligase
MQCTAIVDGASLPLSIGGSLGNQHVYPMLAAVAVVHALGFDVAQAIPVLAGHESPKGRMRIIEGIQGSTIIDDTYNSSPIAVEEALNTLAMIETKGNKIVILGDMLELGVYTEREHIRLGKKAADIVDNLITVGVRSQDFITGAVQAGADKNKTHNFADGVTALNYIKKYVAEEDVILVKGSQGMRLEKIVKYLMADQNKAKDVLVRQEGEWEHR